MKTARAGWTVALAGIVWAAGVYAYDFSADMVMTHGGGKQTGKIFVSGEKARVETQDTVSISRADRKVVWILMPGQKTYMEMAFQPGSVPVEKDAGQIEKVLVGKDIVDGKPASKYRVTYAAGKEKTSVFQWFLESDGFPVKTEALDGSWSQEYRNIKRGNQPADLFEIPAGYSKFSMPALPGR